MNESPLQRYLRLPPADRPELPEEAQAGLAYTWRGWQARPDQVSPEGDWRYWLIMSGRGWGKTRTGAEWVRESVKQSMYVNIVGATADDARDIMIEGESGIMAICPPWERPNYRPALRRLDWPNGAKSLIFTADEPERLRGKQHGKIWCFTAGTPVATPGGQTPVELLVVGDEVLTRHGARRITAIGNRVAPVGTVRFSDGRTLTGTGEHPLLSFSGWTRMDRLSIGQCVQTATSAPTSATAESTASARTFISTVGSGSKNTAQSRRAARFTTATAILRTMRSRTLSASRAASIERSTDLRGCVAPDESESPRPAWNVESLSFVHAPANASAVISNVQTVDEPPSEPATIAESGSCRSVVATALSVASTWAPAGEQTVYNLTVEGEHEYIANGIVVHNCDELAAWRYPETWDQIKFGLRLPPEPQACITTTPKPTQLMRKLVADENTVVTPGATYDNLSNLAPAFAQEIIKEYEGTRLGRQELQGELLLDEGLAYPFSERRHTVAPFDVPPEWTERIEGMDFGSNNPTAVYPVVTDYDGNLIVFGEYHVAGKLPSEHAPALLERRRHWGTSVCFGDPTMWNSASVTNKLGQKASVADEFTDHGYVPVRANNDRRAGYIRLSELFRCDADRIHPAWHPEAGEPGAPRIYIFNTCEKLIEALTFAPIESAEEGPTKGPYPGEAVAVKWESAHGHAHAALRYCVMGKPWASTEPDKVYEDPRQQRLYDMLHEEESDDEVWGHDVYELV